jgi:hypothetical protein
LNFRELSDRLKQFSRIVSAARKESATVLHKFAEASPDTISA